MAKFLQSKNDFPLMVSLGEKKPSWGLSRWRGNSGLRFVPLDDEGFSLRGDRRRLLYKGRRRSHRFTILGDGSFEYDCILLREPESNVITIRMDGADDFDFFRQPDFVSDPFLKGSYAVYKKETLIGEGTGKLCHIHRPEIIDASGRRCWGELAVVGNELRITIPANWLGEAKYPVVVDPTIGTTTIGSQNRWDMDNNSSSKFGAEVEKRIAVNRFLVSGTISGTCRAYARTNGGYSTEMGGRGVIYSESLSKPSSRLSSGEQLIDLQVLASTKPDGWRSATFSVGTVNSGAYIWFGISTENMWHPCFDFGATCYAQKWSSTSTPSSYPSITTTYDLKLSMYFTYAGNFTKRITHGVGVTDSRKNKNEFRRKTTQTVGVASFLDWFVAHSRKCFETVFNYLSVTDFRAFYRFLKEQITVHAEKREERHFFRVFNESENIEAGFKRIQGLLRSFTDTVMSSDNASRFEMFGRRCFDTVANTLTIGRFPVFLRNVKEKIGLSSSKKENTHFSRECEDNANADSRVNHTMGFFRKVDELVYGFDNQDFAVLFYRNVTDTTAVTQASRGIGGFYRTVKTSVKNFDGIDNSVDFFRCQSDSVYAGLSLFRKLDLLVRIVTQLFVRDFFLRRFLKAKSEMVLKSCITRELTIESRIN